MNYIVILDEKDQHVVSVTVDHVPRKDDVIVHMHTMYMVVVVVHDVVFNTATGTYFSQVRVRTKKI